MPEMTLAQREAVKTGDTVYVRIGPDRARALTVKRRTRTMIVLEMFNIEYRVNVETGRASNRLGSINGIYTADAPEIVERLTLELFDRATYAIGERGRLAVRHWVHDPPEAASALLAMAADLVEVSNAIMNLATPTSTGGSGG